MRQQLALQLSELLVTKESADIFLFSLQAIVDASYTKDLDVMKIFEESFPQEIVSLFQQVVQEKTATQKESFQAFLQTLKELVMTMPVVTITFAQKPSQIFLADIAMKIKEYTKEPILIAVACDEKILGGIILRFKGVYKDYSLLSQIKAKNLI